MRVLHVVDTLDPSTGGPARTVPFLVDALQRTGLDCRIWARGTSSHLSDHLGLRAEQGPLGQVLSGTEWDLVHHHGMWLPFHRVVARVCAVRRIHRIVSPRGMLEPWALAHHRWRKRLAWILFQRRDVMDACGVHVTSEAEAAQLRSLGFPGPMACIPNGVEMPSSDSIARFDGPPTVVFLGRIHPVKGLDVLVDAWQRAALPGWRMEVVGPNEDGHQALLEEKLKRAGLFDQWRFAGEVRGDGRWNALRRGHLFVLPSHTENFGLAVAEALAIGLPVIATRGTPWSGVEERGCGRWVDLEPTSLAEALSELTSLPKDRLAAMGQLGREWVRQSFSWSGVATEMKQFYESLP
ncbi:glycosyltransferase [bacterium]|nr:glycosyltransferase [bacterium]